MLRFFIDGAGLSYKAEKPKAPEDMERMNASQEQLNALPNDGTAISLVDHADSMRLGQHFEGDKLEVLRNAKFEIEI